ncbi:hypothetical protein K438DRAFT_1872057 [Mycena galopus ATCC 62051]|nr:hypothetical protein K438DRAFT_1872057 [Mycena galopus ATCC 62051]
MYRAQIRTCRSCPRPCPACRAPPEAPLHITVCSLCTRAIHDPAPYRTVVVAHACNPSRSPSDLQQCPCGAHPLLLVSYRSHEPYPGNCAAHRCCALLPESTSCAHSPSAALLHLTSARAVPAHCYLQLTAGIPPMCGPPCNPIVCAATMLLCACESVPPTQIGCVTG